VSQLETVLLELQDLDHIGPRPTFDTGISVDPMTDPSVVHGSSAQLELPRLIDKLKAVRNLLQLQILWYARANASRPCILELASANRSFPV
jgi:hypothetical protein